MRLLLLARNKGDSVQRGKRDPRIYHAFGILPVSSTTRQRSDSRMKIPVEKSIYRKVYLQLRTGFLTERVGAALRV